MYLALAKNIQITADRKILALHADFVVNDKEKIGIVGRNGAGKTTTLKLLSKETKPRKGAIDVRTTSFYVPQHVELNEMQKELPVISYALTLSDEGWNVFHIIEKLFDYHAITEDKLMKQLSGGELTMLHLALGFLIRPDLLLLDEPTNHLDTYGTKMLVEELKRYQKAIVIVSHDTYLLDEVVTKIFRIRDQQLRVFTGNYSEYKEKEAHEEYILERKLRDEEKKTRKALDRKQMASERLMTRDAEQEKHMKSGIPRIQQGYFYDKTVKTTYREIKRSKQEEADAREAMDKIKEKLKKSQTLNIELGKESKTAFSLLDIKNADLFIGRHKKIVSEISMRITNEDRALLNGRNGSGKSSLMNAIQNNSGYSFQSKSRMILPKKSIYIDQHYSLLDPEKTVMSHISELTSEMEYEEQRRVLGNYLFLNDHQINQRAKSLSGGEKARLSLAIASVQPRTLLLLDEPTNNLDTESIEELILAINNYEGGVMIVTHDLGFIEKVDWTQRFEIKGMKLIVNK